ncbi:MAG: hypothetical protein JWN15_1637 [Firmicutes bacterium]|nr:hypothetical protein [Bacillota bacterium]
MAGTSYTPEELPDTHGSPDRATISDRHELEMLIVAGPVDGAVTALTALRTAGHQLTVITARTPRLCELTEAWLRYHGITVDRLHFLAGGSKVPAALAEGIDLMVEDAPHNANALAEAGVPVLLFGTPYNVGVTHPLIQRCEGWEAVTAEITAWPVGQLGA